MLDGDIFPLRIFFGEYYIILSFLLFYEFAIARAAIQRGLHTKGGIMRSYRRMAFSGLVLGLSLVFALVFQTVALAADEGALVDYINQERSANGLAPLSYSPELSSGASQQAQENAACQCVSHAGQHYTAAENVASAPTAWDAFQHWLGSSFHHANMLSSSYTSVGVGYALDENGNGYYVLNFR